MTATEDHGKTQQGAKDSAPRTLAALAEDLVLIPSSWPSVTPGPGHPMHSSGLHRHQICTQGTDITVGKADIHINIDAILNVCF